MADTKCKAWSSAPVSHQVSNGSASEKQITDLGKKLVFSRNSRFQPALIPLASHSALHTDRNHQFLPYLTPQMTAQQIFKFMERLDEEWRSMPHVLGSFWKLKLLNLSCGKANTKTNKMRSLILPFREASRTCQIWFILSFKMQLLRMD